MTETPTNHTGPQAPNAPKHPTTRTHHGRVFVDDYEWLRDKEAAETIAYLEAENAYTDEVTKDQQQLREDIFQEINTGITPTFHSDPNNTTVAGVALAFVTSKIVGTIQATPGGLGPVEAALTGTLVAVGMTVVEAFGSVFVYRMVSFVMITLLGWVVYFFTYTRKGLSARDAT